MLKQNKGITLIALIITIIVLLILAGVVINMTVGNDGIINKSQIAATEYEKKAILEQLELEKMSALALPEHKGKITVDEMVDFLVNESGIAETSTETGEHAGSKIIVVGKYLVEVIPQGQSVRFEIIGDAKVDNQDVILDKENAIVIEDATPKSLMVKVNGQHLRGASFKFICKEKNNALAEEIEITSALPKCTISNLKQEKTYEITVEVTKNGKTSTASAEGTTTKLEIAEGQVSFETSWENGKLKAQVTNNTELRMFYYIGTTAPQNDANYSNEVTGPVYVDANNILYVALTDGVNYVLAGQVDATDDAVEDAQIVLSGAAGTGPYTAAANETVTMQVTLQDSKSGIKLDECKYVINNTSDTFNAQAGDYLSNFTESFDENPKTINVPQAKGTYYIHILSKDIAGNTKETVGPKIQITAAVETVTGNSMLAAIQDENTETNYRTYLGRRVTNYTATNGATDWRIFDIKDDGKVILIKYTPIKFGDVYSGTDESLKSNETVIGFLRNNELDVWKNYVDNTKTDVICYGAFNLNELRNSATHSESLEPVDFIYYSAFGGIYQFDPNCCWEIFIANDYGDVAPGYGDPRENCVS